MFLKGEENERKFLSFPPLFHITFLFTSLFFIPLPVHSSYLPFLPLSILSSFLLPCSLFFHQSIPFTFLFHYSSPPVLQSSSPPVLHSFHPSLSCLLYFHQSLPFNFLYSTFPISSFLTFLFYLCSSVCLLLSPCSTGPTRSSFPYLSLSCSSIPLPFFPYPFFSTSMHPFHPALPLFHGANSFIFHFPFPFYFRPFHLALPLFHGANLFIFPFPFPFNLHPFHLTLPLFHGANYFIFPFPFPFNLHPFHLALPYFTVPISSSFAFRPAHFLSILLGLVPVETGRAHIPLSASVLSWDECSLSFRRIKGEEKLFVRSHFVALGLVRRPGHCHINLLAPPLLLGWFYDSCGATSLITLMVCMICQ